MKEMTQAENSRRLETRIFIQARMSSNRLPGKVLAPFRGEPLILSVLRAASQTSVGKAGVVLLTSDDVSDDPLACYVGALGFAVFRGPLDDVLGRFRRASSSFPCNWLVRICADSPLMDSSLIDAVMARRGPAFDLVTNTFPRSFPKGLSVEVVRSDALAALPDAALTADDREHVTPYFYRNADRFRILNLRSAIDLSGEPGCAVDTLEDLRRLEKSPGLAVQLAADS